MLTNFPIPLFTFNFFFQFNGYGQLRNICQWLHVWSGTKLEFYNRSGWTKYKFSFKSFPLLSYCFNQRHFFCQLIMPFKWRICNMVTRSPFLKIVITSNDWLEENNIFSSITHIYIYSLLKSISFSRDFTDHFIAYIWELNLYFFSGDVINEE